MNQKEYQQQYQRARRQWLKEHHLCFACKKKDFRTLEGFCYCKECAEKARRWYRKKVKGGAE